MFKIKAILVLTFVLLLIVMGIIPVAAQDPTDEVTDVIFATVEPTADITAEPAPVSTEVVISDDLDGDGVADNADSCPDASNPDQTDSDGDNIGDACDPDLDNDGVMNTVDNCPLNANPAQLDEDSDGLGRECDEVDILPEPTFWDNTPWESVNSILLWLFVAALPTALVWFAYARKAVGENVSKVIPFLTPDRFESLIKGALERAFDDAGLTSKEDRINWVVDHIDNFDNKWFGDKVPREMLKSLIVSFYRAVENQIASPQPPDPLIPTGFRAG